MDHIRIVAEGDLDGTLETMGVTVVARSLIGLMLLHQGDKFFGTPSWSSEIIVVGC